MIGGNRELIIFLIIHIQQYGFGFGDGITLVSYGSCQLSEILIVSGFAQ
ncbi:Uncharacterised protein [Vibrio cholerae]|nr:Uncharacterised protein [Vibrio cholerae]